MPKINHFLVLVCSYCITASAIAQSKFDSLSVTKSLKNVPHFTINKDNYIISGSKVGQTPSSLNSDAKLQFSFKQRLHNKPLPFNAYLFFIYTQKSFWDIYRDSSPFTETNYNPSISAAKSVFRKGHLKGVLSTQVEHESNGLQGNDSRSWNNFSISYLGMPHQCLRFFAKAWVPFYYASNRDLFDYIGFSESRITLISKNNRLNFDITFRKAMSFDWRGNLQLELSYKPLKTETVYLLVQYWEGYAESLVHYRESTSRIRFGIVFKPSYFVFY